MGPTHGLRNWTLALAVGAAVSSVPAHAADAAGDGGDALHSVPAQIRLSVERLRLPQDEALGLVGTTYLVDVGHHVELGPAAYGAVSGRRGGLFTLGGEVAVHQPLAGPLAFGAGVYVGGGGGGSAPVGSGLMIRPHADLTWDVGPFTVGVSASKVRFGGSGIDSNQIGLVLAANTAFRFVSADRTNDAVDGSGRSGVGFDRFEAVVGVYRPRRTSKRISGQRIADRIGTVGVRVDSAIGRHAYVGLEASAADSGGTAGYAEYLGVLGTETAVGDSAVVGLRGALGMGGGGDIDVGGGLLAKAAAYGTVRLTRDLGLTVEGGYAVSPQGTFKALQASAALSWLLDDPNDHAAPARNSPALWAIGSEHYSAARRDGTKRGLDAVTLRFDRFVAEHVYLSGQAHSAAGGGAGGYSVGLFGLGVEAPLASKFSVGAELAAGAAGGGGVDTQGGVVVQPMAHLIYRATEAISLRIGAGAIKALHGPLSSPVIDAALEFRFGIFSHGYH